MFLTALLICNLFAYNVKIRKIAQINFPENFDPYDSGTFRNYCGPAQLHKDMNTLYGLIVGIQADGHINETEIDLLYSWVNSLGTLRTKAPYHKLVVKINEINYLCCCYC